MEILLTANLLEPGASLDSWAVMKKNRFFPPQRERQRLQGAKGIQSWIDCIFIEVLINGAFRGHQGGLNEKIFLTLCKGAR